MILLLTPVLSLAGVKETFTELYHGYEYEQYKREIEEQEKYFEDLDLFEFLPEEYLYVQEDTFATDGEEAELRQDTPSYGKPVNEIKVEDIREFDINSKAAMEQRAIENGLLDKAFENAKSIIYKLLDTDMVEELEYSITFETINE